MHGGPNDDSWHANFNGAGGGGGGGPQLQAFLEKKIDEMR